MMFMSTSVRLMNIHWDLHKETYHFCRSIRKQAIKYKSRLCLIFDSCILFAAMRMTETDDVYRMSTYLYYAKV